MPMIGELQAKLKAILASASFKSVSGAAGEHAVLAMIAGREELGLGEKATYCVSQFLFDRERVPGVSVILAILVVWGWVDAVEIVAGRSDFDLEGDSGLGGGVAGRKATSGRYGPFRSVQGHAEWCSFSSQSRPPLPASDFENRSLSHDVRGAVRCTAAHV